MAQLGPAVYTVREVAALLRKQPNQVYEAIARGELPALRLGRSILIPRVPFERLLEGNADAAP